MVPSDLRLSDRHNSSDKKLKFVYATEAMRRYQVQRVSPKLQEVGVPPTLVIFPLKGHSRAMSVQF